MKAITVRQPWAGLILHGGKNVENRSRNIAGSYRGPLVVHSSLTLATLTAADGDPWTRLYDAVGLSTSDDACGVALGVVDLVDVHWSGMEGGMSCPQGCNEYNLCSAWAEAYTQHLILANPHAFAEPIPYRGRLGLWEFPDDLLRQADLNGWAT